MTTFSIDVLDHHLSQSPLPPPPCHQWHQHPQCRWPAPSTSSSDDKPDKPVPVAPQQWRWLSSPSIAQPTNTSMDNNNNDANDGVTTTWNYGELSSLPSSLIANNDTTWMMMNGGKVHGEDSSKSPSLRSLMLITIQLQCHPITNINDNDPPGPNIEKWQWTLPWRARCWWPLNPNVTPPPSSPNNYEPSSPATGNGIDDNYPQPQQWWWSPPMATAPPGLLVQSIEANPES